MAGLTGCDSSSPAKSLSQGDAAYTVVCTTGMVADIVRQVAGDRANVVQLMGAGVDPHLYQPTFDDVSRLRDADIVFYNGLHLEGQMQQTLESLARTQRVYALTQDIDPTLLRTPAEFQGHPDPHVWMDVTLWMQAVDAVARRLEEFDPTHATLYEQNAARYQAELQELDKYVMGIVATIPTTQRHLLTAHDAFGYFGRHYSIDVISVQGIRPNPSRESTMSIISLTFWSRTACRRFLWSRALTRTAFVRSSKGPRATLTTCRLGERSSPTPWEPRVPTKGHTWA